MYAANVDANQGEIVKALRALGWSVELIHRVGKGVPDLLVGAYGLNILIEVKDPAQRGKLGKFERAHRGLNKAENDWHAGWGGQVAIAFTAEEAIGLVRDIAYKLGVRTGNGDYQHRAVTW